VKQLNQIIIMVLLLVVLGVGGFFATKQIKSKNKDARQAVFLSNGQVYFGHVSHENSKWVILKEVFYLQVQQPLQPPKDAATNEQPQVSLVKLGNELHGPQDEMKIDRDDIIFIEDMKSDSKVNQAIGEFEKNGGQTPAVATPAPSPTK
jgi:hypothetical protein